MWLITFLTNCSSIQSAREIVNRESNNTITQRINQMVQQCFVYAQSADFGASLLSLFVSIPRIRGFVKVSAIGLDALRTITDVLEKREINPVNSSRLINQGALHVSQRISELLVIVREVSGPESSSLGRVINWSENLSSGAKLCHIATGIWDFISLPRLSPPLQNPESEQKERRAVPSQHTDEHHQNVAQIAEAEQKEGSSQTRFIDNLPVQPARAVNQPALTRISDCLQDDSQTEITLAELQPLCNLTIEKLTFVPIKWVNEKNFKEGKWPSCTITSLFIRFIVIPKGHNGIYYEKDALLQYIKISSIPKGWPKDLPISLESIEVESELQEQINEELKMSLQNIKYLKASLERMNRVKSNSQQNISQKKEI